MSTLFRTMVVASVFAGAFMAAPAHAALITDGSLVLDTNPSSFYQQTQSSPCVIGGNNCQNPATFPSVDSPNTAGTFDISSLIYTDDQVEAVALGATFTIGIDYNQTRIAQTLYEFEARYLDAGQNLISSQLFDIPNTLPTNNNGSGYSDFLLSGFVIPDSAVFVQFRAEWLQNDGPDRYFIIGSKTTSAPEPASMLLLGTGLAAFAAARRRRRR